MKFDNMPDNMKSTEVFFRLERCSNIFSRLSSIIPKQLLAVVQSIHGELCESLVLVSRAGNEPIPNKLEYLTLAERKLFLSVQQDTVPCRSQSNIHRTGQRVYGGTKGSVYTDKKMAQCHKEGYGELFIDCIDIIG